MPEQVGDVGVEVLRSATATLKRAGTWKVPPRLEVESLTGAVKLDFRTAILPGDAVDIEVKSGTGAVDLIPSEGATADVSGLTQGPGTSGARPIPGRLRASRASSCTDCSAPPAAYVSITGPKLLGLF